MQAGEVLRRTAFNALDLLHGNRQKKLKEINKQIIVKGVNPELAAKRKAKILAYAAKNCAFYRELPHHESLTDFPVQNKGDFIAHYEGVLSDEYKPMREKLAKLSTSGSTGTPFTVLADPRKMDHVFMNFMSVMELNGFRLGMKRAEFRAWIKGKNTISAFRSFKNNLMMYDISNMGDEALQAICDRIKRERIQCLVMYSSALTALSSYVDRKKVDTTGWDVEMIFTMGEAMPDSTRELAAKVFRTVPVRSYGNNENGFVAVSLNDENDYTIDLFNYEVEILSLTSDEPVPEGELGRIVVTDYSNRAFPMIRYDTGDTGKIKRWTDEKGRQHAKFTEIYGRRGSMLYNTAGEPLSIHVFMNVLLNFEGMLRQAKMIQTEVDAYDLYLNPVDRAACDEAAVVAAYKKYLGDDAKITVHYVEDLPIQQSGKTMVCENHCKAYL
ncbi:MAG: phenylacetate--CoA ligase family protein [Lachnospiraceae bacterium]|nr:phenylacetate--CoA ligase family protein [Lachnospiraceae bacterium]